MMNSSDAEMTRAKLLEALAEYRKLDARIEYLSIRAKKIENAMNAAGDDGISGAQLESRRLTGMPSAHNVVSVVENVVLMREKVQMELGEQEKRVLEELKELSEKKETIDSLMRALSDENRFIVQERSFRGKKWEDVAETYSEQFLPISVSGVRRRFDNAVSEMLDVVNGEFAWCA